MSKPNIKHELSFLNRLVRLYSSGQSIEARVQPNSSVKFFVKGTDKFLIHIAHVEDLGYMRVNTMPDNTEYFKEISLPTIQALSYVGGFSLKGYVIIKMGGTEVEVLQKVITDIRNGHLLTARLNHLSKYGKMNDGIKHLTRRQAKLRAQANIVAEILLAIDELPRYRQQPDGNLPSYPSSHSITEILGTPAFSMFLGEQKGDYHQTHNFMTALVDLATGGNDHEAARVRALNNALECVINHFMTTHGRRVCLAGISQMDKILNLSCAMSQFQDNVKPKSLLRGKVELLRGYL